MLRNESQNSRLYLEFPGVPLKSVSDLNGSNLHAGEGLGHRLLFFRLYNLWSVVLFLRQEVHKESTLIAGTPTHMQ